MTSMLLHLALGAALGDRIARRAGGRRGIRRLVRASCRRRAAVEIDNQNFYDANIYVVQGLRSVRLGTVTGLTKATFQLPRDIVGGGSVRFAIRPLASQRSRADAGDHGFGR